MNRESLRSPGTWRRLATGDANLSKKQQHTVIAWIAIAPVMAWLLVYKYIALFWNVVLTFFDRSYTGEMTFVGLENWAQAFQDPVFPTALRNTIVLFGTIPVGIALALFIAILLNQKFPGSKAFRSVFFLPYITMMVAIAVIWQYMFHTEQGVINYALLNVGLIDDPISWLGNGRWALFSVFLVHIWKTTGFYVIIILAGLQTIPRQVYEVSRIDGASRWQQFRYLTLPLLKPTIGVCMLVGVVISFRLFDLILVMTDGGPGYSTEILLTWIYKQSFSYNDFGYGAVLSVIMVITTFTVAYLGLKLQQVSYS
ncbi:carbohydrate ABC transporter permease [Halosolutus gelatinilyticus]|uniref:carbohydrate ABC transporter permease n=1 Tax=Halosolutus gelatinilyticus TaxID=2931975 RepID=UPI001FF2F6A1|nr:sugar ABC transporter permease [Halosolutus gelatinilyticus]